MRREMLKAGAAALAGLAVAGTWPARPALAQGGGERGWPSRPIRLIIPYIPGSAPDVLMRLLGEPMGAALGQPVVIENRGGAGGSIGNEAAARAAPDGHTLLLGTNAMLILPQLHRRSLGYDPLRDFTPIAGLTALPHALVVPAGGPASVAELVASLKARPGQPYASGGNGSPAHLAAEMFREKAGVDATHVPFRGAPEIVNSLIAGQVSFGFPTLSTVTEMVRAGRLQALGVTSPGRNRVLPEVPAIAETLPGFDVVSWFALLGPAGLPPEIVRRVEQAALRALADPEVRVRIEADGTNVLGTPADEFVSFYRAEYRKWGEAVRLSGAQVD